VSPTGRGKVDAKLGMSQIFACEIAGHGGATHVSGLIGYYQVAEK
jgi:hypothetical protein